MKNEIYPNEVGQWLSHLYLRLVDLKISNLAEEFGHSLPAKVRIPCSALPFPFYIAISKNKNT